MNTYREQGRKLLVYGVILPLAALLGGAVILGWTMMYVSSGPAIPAPLPEPATLAAVTPNATRIDAAPVVTNIYLYEQRPDGTDVNLFMNDVTSLLKWMERHRQVNDFVYFHLQVPWYDHTGRTGVDDNDIVVGFLGSDIPKINWENMTNERLLNLSAITEQEREARSSQPGRLATKFLFFNRVGVQILRKYCMADLSAREFCERASGYL